MTIPLAQLKHDLCMEQAKSNEHFARALRLEAAICLHPDSTRPGAVTLAQRYAESAEAATRLALEYRSEAAGCLADTPTARITQ